MPTFSIVLANEARASIASERRAALVGEYIGYIERVGDGKRACRLPVRAGPRRRSGADWARRWRRWAGAWRSVAREAAQDCAMEQPPS